MKIRKESCFRNYFIHFWAKNHVVRKTPPIVFFIIRRHIFSLFLRNHKLFFMILNVTNSTTTSTSLKYFTCIFKTLDIFRTKVYKVFYSLLLGLPPLKVCLCGMPQKIWENKRLFISLCAKQRMHLLKNCNRSLPTKRQK